MGSSTKSRKRLQETATTGAVAHDADYNPRRITPAALAGLRDSLNIFGDLSGFVWNDVTGNIVCGHQRRAALNGVDLGAIAWGDPYTVELGQTDGRFKSTERDGWIPAPGGGARFRVRRVSWPENFEKAANVAANNPHLQGEFTENLAELIAEIQAENAGLPESLRFDELLKDCGVGESENLRDIPPPPPPQKPITSLGDLWLLGSHRVLCGDSTNEKDVAKLMNGEKGRVMNTDPPYGIAYNSSDLHAHGVDYGEIENDDLLDGQKLQRFLEAAIRAAVGHLEDNAAFYLWHPMLTQGTFFAAAAAAAAADILIHRQIIWVKPVLVFGRGDYHWKHELCFYGWRRGHRPPFYGERNQVTVWPVDSIDHNDRKTFAHASPKPIGLFVQPLCNHTLPGEIAFDPFAGTGPQIIAAEQLGRRCYSMEIVPEYCDVIVQRWEKLTGKKADLERAK